MASSSGVASVFILCAPGFRNHWVLVGFSETDEGANVEFLNCGSIGKIATP